MLNRLLIVLLCMSSIVAVAQSPGDTIVVETFKYNSTTRDSVFQFPNLSGVTYEKVLMLYNMRCKNGLVSPPVSGQTNLGCGEWDYSCNTYLTDSSRIDSLPGSRASHNISNFSGTVYPYTTTPVYNLYRYNQINTTATILSETQSTAGTGSIVINHALMTDKQSGRSQYLLTQSELLAAGVTAGPIDGILLHATSNSTAGFLKIGLKHSTASALNAATPDVSGFTETFNANQSFVTGSNRLQFHTPFVWDGTSNIIIDLSTTNSTPMPVLTLEGDVLGAGIGLYTNNGYYVNNSTLLSASLPVSPFSSVSNEITVAFWSRGNAGISSKNTSILEAVDPSMNRTLNLHHPWGNSNVYFDCGNAGSSYDRINKAATIAEIEQNWQHWAFTKNATTGIMNIYLNGTLWHTGTGKTNPINIDSMMLFANINRGNHYSGDMDELSIWNTALSAADIQAWMNKTITPLHPNYSNLLAYYRMDEGSGALLHDSSTNAQLSNAGINLNWKFTRGDRLSRFFTETNERPKITFLQGNYTLSNSTVQVLDSLQASPNIVRAYTVLTNPGTINSDTYSLISTNAYWHAAYRYEYDGVTNALLDSFVVAPTGTITIVNLPYTERYPSKYEIMSFVTPYGINLDLGMNGKTWTFDMTDFVPLLNGRKRISIERGGQWQEDMDIKFLFIVGTPVRDVKDVTQIWRQPNNCNYNQIINNTFYEPRDVTMRADGKFFKVRSMITGHGQEGEFIPRDHTLNINGGADEFTWLVYKRCASNPVYPQGGTWIYDRTGWCPGMATDVKEMDITPFVTPGQLANIDYHMVPIVSPPVGNSNYLISHHLVTYGDFNFTLDAAVVDIIAPTNKVEHARKQAICANPTVVIQNTGSTPITSLTIEYWINQNTTKSVANWTGNLAPLETVEVPLSNSSLWYNITSPNNVFHVEIKNPNGAADQYSFNNIMSAPFKITDVMPSDFIVFHRTNNAASETSYELTDEWGNVLLSRSGLSNSTTYRDTMKLGFGCYKFTVTDSDEDGVSFFANSDGAGSFSFRQLNNAIIKTFIPDFGAGFEYNFTIDYPLSFEQIMAHESIELYPNPATDQVFIKGNNIEQATLQVRNAVGQAVVVPVQKSAGKLTLQTSHLSRGIYYVQMNVNGQRSTHKLVIE